MRPYWERKQMADSILRECAQIEYKIRHGEFTTPEELDWLSAQREPLRRQAAELLRGQ
jgi:hypothetical protein